MKITHILAVLCMIVITSCSKDDSVTTSTTKKDLLTGGSSKSWIISKIVSSYNGTSTDVTSSFPTCSKDNISTFKSDGSVLKDEGATKCASSDPQTSTGTFTINTAETEITLKSATEGTVTAQIVELTSTKFTESVSITASGITSTTTTTFVPK